MAEPHNPQRVKDIKIKTGVVKRLAKEKVSYEKELEKQQQKVVNMKAENPDDYDIRKQQEVLEETRKMIPDCERRLTVAWEDLSKLMELDTDLRDTEEYQLAQQTLDETKVAAGR